MAYNDVSMTTGTTRSSNEAAMMQKIEAERSALGASTTQSHFTMQVEVLFKLLNEAPVSAFSDPSFTRHILREMRSRFLQEVAASVSQELV